MGEELVLQPDDDALPGVVHQGRLGEGGPAADEEDDEHRAGYLVEAANIVLAEGRVDDRLHEPGESGRAAR